MLLNNLLKEDKLKLSNSLFIEYNRYKLHNIYKISSVFFLLSLTFVPFFNNFPWLQDILKAFRSPSYLLLILMICIYFFESLYKKIFIIKIERHMLLIILFLFFYNFLTFFINYSMTGKIYHSESYNKMFSTNLKYIFLIFIIHYINILPVYSIKRYIQYGFLITITYTFFEIIDFLFSTEKLIIINIEYLFHDRLADWGSRTRGMSFEPSYQSVVLIFLLPFIFQKKFYLYMFLIGLISTFSVTGFISLVYFYIFYKFKGLKLLIINIFIIINLLFLFLFFQEYIDFNNMHSTTTRIGSWIASIILIAENFLFGVGPGMSGYWLIFNYTDFFYLSVEAHSWIEQGKNNLEAPSFASILTFLLDYGVIPLLLLVFYFIKFRIFSYISNCSIARASIAALLVASFGIDSYGFIGFFIFLSITITKKWHLFDESMIAKNK